MFTLCLKRAVACKLHQPVDVAVAISVSVLLFTGFDVRYLRSEDVLSDESHGHGLDLLVDPWSSVIMGFAEWRWVFIIYSFLLIPNARSMIFAYTVCCLCIW